jgi:two-component system OmpR family sensor kinase
LRLRLTLWFVFAVFIIALLGAAAMYAVLSHQLRDDIDSRLAQQLTRYEEMVTSATDQQSLVDLTRSYLTSNRANSLRQNGFVLSLQTPDGSVISSSDVIHLEDLPASRQILESGARILTDAQLSGEEYRVAGTPVMTSGRIIGAVEIAGSLTEVNATLNRLLLLLVVGGLIGCAAVGLGSWFLLGSALEPVRRITRTAAAISREDLSKRIGYKGPKDEIGELAETMDGMLDRLENAFAAQEQFISDVSHELRTPLTIVKGHLQVLDREENPSVELVKQEHGLVIDELDRMNRLIADLLTLARAGRADFLRKEPVNLDLFLTSLAGQGPHLGEREWTIDSLPGGTVAADQDRLTQVFLNLMHNAVAHTVPGQVIGLGGVWEQPGPTSPVGEVRLWVRDEGEGMDEEVRTHLFERFYRGTGDVGGGRVGLGLAIAKALIAAHGGSISVESAPGRGARFTVTLPSSYLGRPGWRAGLAGRAVRRHDLYRDALGVHKSFLIPA